MIVMEVENECVAQLVEQLIFNQPVRGSIPLTLTILLEQTMTYMTSGPYQFAFNYIYECVLFHGKLAGWFMATVLKTVGFRAQGFESLAFLHVEKYPSWLKGRRC